MREFVRKKGESVEYYTPEKCYITEILNVPEVPQMSLARARVEPSVTTRWHRLKGVSECYYILSGQGVVEVGELKPRQVGPGDFVFIPPLCRQRVTNTGKEDLIFLAICTPRFTFEAYEDLENG